MLEDRIPAETPSPWASGYRALAALVLNTLIVFVALNLALAAVDGLRGMKQRWHSDVGRSPASIPSEAKVKPSPRRNQYQVEWGDLRGFAGKTPAEAEQVLDEFYELGKLGMVFRPYTHFTEPVFRGAKLNVATDARGFEYRPNGSAPRPEAAKPFRVFFFGGSTTFGYHAADDWTVPAYLETALRETHPGAEVMNYGHGYYYWFQELVLLQKMIVAGHKPDAIVFLDGVNLPVQGELPTYSEKLARLWDEAQTPEYQPLLPAWLPVFRWVNLFRGVRNDAVYSARYATPAPGGVPEQIARVVWSYASTVAQARAVAEAVGAKSYFFWQPNRFHECGWTGAVPPDYAKVVNVIAGVSGTMEKWKAPAFAYLGDLCKRTGVDQPLFVDRAHYGPRFSAVIAREIASRMTKK